VRNSKTNVEMECFVFKSRIFLGTIAAASVLAGTTAAPALAVNRPHHITKPTAVTTPLKGVTGTVKGATSGGLASTLVGGLAGTLASGLAGAAPVTGALGGLSNLPLVGPLLAAVSSAAPGGATSATDPVTNVLHGVTSAVSGLGSGAGATSAVSGAVSSVTGTLKSVPLVGQVADALPDASPVTGALSGITSAVPAASAITSLLPTSNG
jgi:hypothetical protein